MADAVTIGKFMTLLSDNFGSALSKVMTEYVTEMLSKFSNEQLDTGLNRLLGTRKYNGFPKIAEILEAIQGGNQQEVLATEAEATFTQVCALEHDPTGYPTRKALAKLNAPARFALRQMGGNTNAWTGANLDFKRKTFIEIYMRMANNPKKLAELGYTQPSRPALELIQGTKAIGDA